MPITLGCPSCGKRFRARDESAGKKVKCPYCQAAVPVPTAEETAKAVGKANFEKAVETIVKAGRTIGKANFGKAEFHDAITELATIHGWKTDNVIMCILFLAQIGERVSDDEFRRLMRIIDVEVSDLASDLKRLVSSGDVCWDIETQTYYLDRKRRTQFESVLRNTPSEPIPAPVIISPAPVKRRNRLLKIGIRAILVAILTGLGSQIGGWVGGLVTATLASLTAVWLGDVGGSSGH